MNMLDYIVVAKGLISDTKCDEIVSMFKDSDEWMNAACGSDSGYHPDVRNCNIIRISQPAEEKYVSEARTAIDQELFGIVSSAVRSYIEKFPFVSSVINRDEGYDIMRYESGQKVARHIDVGASSATRALSCSIQLNDGFVGGEWQFFGDTKIVVEKGDIVMFPSNFCFDHEVTPVTEGVRYSVLTFLGYRQWKIKLNCSQRHLYDNLLLIKLRLKDLTTCFKTAIGFLNRTLFMVQSVELKRVLTCPLGHKCQEAKGDHIEQCAWFTKLAGENPQTGEQVDEFGCAMTWLPVLLVENARTNRGTSAAVESFRNEMVNANSSSQQLLMAAAQLHPSHLKLVSNK